jgi:hypothetical protein
MTQSKKLNRSQAASVASTAKWQNHREDSIKALKKGWKGRKKRVEESGVKDSAFTINERMAFSQTKLVKSNNHALLYLRNLGITPNRKDGLTKAVRKLVVNNYKNPVNFYKQFLNVIHQTIKQDIKVDIWKLMDEVNRTRVELSKPVYKYSGELTQIIK